MRPPPWRSLGLHARGDTEHPGVQLLVQSQIDLDIADGVPPVLIQVLLDEFRQRARELDLPRHQSFVVGGRQGDPVTVRREHLPVAHHVPLVLGFALQRGTNLDRFDLTFEYACERTADEALEAAFKPLSQAHVILLGLGP
jgi:hypothetical protein